MIREMMKSKIHRATVTEADLNYAGSMSIDAELMRLSDIRPMEKISVVNINTGSRFETYAIEAPSGSGTIGLNGGAARLGIVGDLVIIISYAYLEDKERYEGKVVLVNEENKPTDVNVITEQTVTY
ncbi:aspartate 1-decarboxylase [bacterium]|nr:aspartate 1-decarboxylase [bacterium]MBU1024916.1 aspartate 1-decarboxylase [bacterium]